jgi:FkbM family methyltransferase
MLKNIAKKSLMLIQDILTLDFKSKYLNHQSTPVRIKQFGYKVWGNNFTTLRYLKKEIFDNEEYYFRTTNTEPTIIDCGSNIGMSILYFKHLYPKAKIIGFEPNPSSFSLLQRNIKINNIANVELHNACLSNNNKPVEFYCGPAGSNSLIGSMFPSRTNDNKINVNSIKLSEIINGSIVDAVKIDVEGAEWLIIEDLIENNCLKNINTLLIEYHHKIGLSKSNLSKFLGYLELNGFEYNIRTNYKKRESFQDIFIEAYQL